MSDCERKMNSLHDALAKRSCIYARIFPFDEFDLIRFNVAAKNKDKK